MLAQLLDDRHAAMWQPVLYGVTGGSGDIVEVAASQIGNVGGSPTGHGTGSPAASSGARAS